MNSWQLLSLVVQRRVHLTLFSPLPREIYFRIAHRIYEYSYETLIVLKTVLGHSEEEKKCHSLRKPVSHVLLCKLQAKLRVVAM